MPAELVGSLLSAPRLSRTVPEKLRDYFELTKPGIAAVVLMTTTAGFIVASNAGRPAAAFNWTLLLHTLLGTGLTAAGAGALNMLLEQEPDALMNRTKNRPLPAGRASPEKAFFLGMLAGSLGIVHLAAMVNLRACFLACLSLTLYLSFYTPMKKSSSFCTVIGAVSGAIPPLIGWTAARNSFDIGGWALFAILFVWQFPHLLALAWLFKEDYSRAGFKMMPLRDDSGKTTAIAAGIFCLILVPVSLVPSRLGLSGPVYFWSALTLGTMLLGAAIPFLRGANLISARKLFLATILYPPCLFLLMSLGQ